MILLSNSYTWGPPSITLNWMVDPRGLADSKNPLDHPWNFDSATVAKHRLRAATRADRIACGDGKWVKVREKVVCMIPWQAYASESPIVHELLRHWERQDKARYRWEVRR